jgi:hypothetical protein
MKKHVVGSALEFPDEETNTPGPVIFSPISFGTPG